MGGPPHPDLVVLDVMMPDLDGFEVCRRMRADGDGTPVLFLTARDSTSDKVRGLTLGGDDYLILRESDVLAKVIAETKSKSKKKELAGAAA